MVTKLSLHDSVLITSPHSATALCTATRIKRNRHRPTRAARSFSHDDVVSRLRVRATRSGPGWPPYSLRCAISSQVRLVTRPTASNSYKYCATLFYLVLPNVPLPNKQIPTTASDIARPKQSDPQNLPSERPPTLKRSLSDNIDEMISAIILVIITIFCTFTSPVRRPPSPR